MRVNNVPDITFEEVKLRHLPDLLEIYTYYVLNTTATFHARRITEKEMGQIVFFDGSKYKTFVVLDGEQVCGYVMLSPYKKREAYHLTAEVALYLRHDRLGQGIGGKALAYIENYARKKGIHVLVSTICGENSRSIRLFEKSGYEKCAHYKEIGKKFGRMLDVVAYQKILNEEK